MTRACAGGLALWLSIGSSFGGAAADTSCPAAEGEAFVAVAVEERVDVPREAFVKQLAAELSRQKVAVCPLGAPSARAEVRVSPPEHAARGAQVAVEVRGAAGTGGVRHVELAGLGGSARALIVAIAAAELLRATGAVAPEPEVAKKPPDLAPNEVRAVAPPASVTPDLRQWSLTLSFAGQAFADGQALIGPELRVGRAVGDHVRLELGASAGRALREETTSGFVEGAALALDAGLSWSLVQTARWALALGPRAAVAFLRYTATAMPGARARDGEATAAFGWGVAAARFQIAERLRLAAELRAGAPLKRVHLLDGNDAFSAVAGLALGAGLGVEGAF